MEKIILLSHPFKRSNPVYGAGMTEVELYPAKCISQGDSCNTISFKINNHIGTHVDAPAHFFENGKGVTEVPLEDWIFSQPQVLDLDIPDNDLLIRSICLDGKIEDCTDLLIIKTGWYKIRESKRYSTQNPGIHSEVAILLREKYPNVRAIMFDFISLSSFSNREEGRRSHREFLKPEEPIFIIEDADLSSLDTKPTKLSKVIVAPWMLSFADSAPCTIYGVIDFE